MTTRTELQKIMNDKSPDTAASVEHTSPPKVRVDLERGVLEPVPEKGESDEDHFRKMQRVFGTKDPALIGALSTEILSVSSAASTEGMDAVAEQHLNSGLAFLHGIQPRDEVEGCLVTQMYTCHTFAMRYCAQLAAGVPVEQFDRKMNAINKLMRTYLAQMESLNRYRGKGQQKVTVEHVTVNAGGRAIVGHVETGGGV